MRLLSMFKRNKEPKFDPKNPQDVYNLIKSNVKMMFTEDSGDFFTGETDTFQFGDTHSYVMDYETLRERSWQLYAENELVKSIVDRKVTFAVGTGLKLQAQPEQTVLEDMGVHIDAKSWTKKVEAYFRIYSRSKNIDHSNKKALPQLEKEIYKHALIGGDCLIIERIDKKKRWLNYQIIDGSMLGSPSTRPSEAGSHIIDNGVELDSQGRHVAYYVKSKALSKKDDTNYMVAELDYKRVLAYSRTTGRRKAYLHYGGQYRSSQARGMPLIAVCMQKAKQIDRYSKAELASAEINANFVGTIEHEDYSSGENPISKTLLGSRGNREMVAPETNLTGYSNMTGDSIAGKIAKGIKGTIVNLGRGQKLKAHSSDKQSVNYVMFYESVAKYMCSACGIPFEVATMTFGSNFSASRASTKMFEEILVNERVEYSSQFNQFVYESFLIYYSSLGILQSDDLVVAFLDDNYLLQEAFMQARFFGKPIPHIDPKKEVESAILKLSNGLSTYEKESEVLGLGDFEDNIKRLQEEKKLMQVETETETEKGENEDEEDEQNKGEDDE